MSERTRRRRERWLCEHWRVGVIDRPVHALLAPGPLPPIRWVTPPEQAGYWADPFGLPGSDSRLYCERFDERSGLGHIELLELDGDRVRPLHRVELGRGLHASFPHAFELDGQCWGIAETGAARECVLHRIDDDGHWTPHTVLLADRAVADPAIFVRQGRHWLAFSDGDAGPHDTLLLFHADRVEGPWRPHAANPVRVDRGGARMAGGFFEHEGRLYRPGQDCRGTYGAAVVIHRVDECTPTSYRETAVRVLEPDPHGPLPHGLHTLTAWGERTLVDGKRYGFNPAALVRKLARRASGVLA